MPSRTRPHGTQGSGAHGLGNPRSPTNLKRIVAARPLGALVFGHYGDPLGRKKLLVLSLLLMGGATFAIGLPPTHATVGAAAPVLLTALRLVQGSPSYAPRLRGSRPHRSRQPP